MTSPRGRTVVTGVGVVAPGGGTREDFWRLLTAGRTATRRISLFDPTGFRSQVGAECDFDPVAAGLTQQEIHRNDRFAQFALVAAAEAMAHSGLDDVDHDRMAVSMGSAVGATTRLEDEYRAVSNDGEQWLVDEQYASRFLYHAMAPSSLATEIACRFGAHGPAAVISTGCTSGLDAIGYGHQLIEDGDADVVIAGASDAPIARISVACFDAIRATTARNDDPEHASRPFDATRDGFVMGEGAAVLILEEYEHARARDATILAEVGGFANRCNAFHMTGLRPDGIEMAEAINDALRQAGRDPHAVSYVNAHGSGTLQNDRHETAAVKRSLGQHAYRTPMSSIKSMVGHSLGAIGAIELAACVLAIRDGTVPPTANLEHADPECDLDYVPRTARAHKVDTVLSVGSGFGGFQSAVVLTRPAGRQR